jgi:hypothetical protein
MRWLAHGGGSALVRRSATEARVWLRQAVAAVTRAAGPRWLTAVVTARTQATRTPADPVRCDETDRLAESVESASAGRK